MTSLQIHCFSKLGHFASRLRSSWDSGFSVKIGTVPPKSGQLDTLLYFGHYNISRLQIDGLIMNHEQFFGLIMNHRLNFEASTYYDSKVLSPIMDHDETLYALFSRENNNLGFFNITLQSPRGIGAPSLG